MGFYSPESLRFVDELYDRVKAHLHPHVFTQRKNLGTLFADYTTLIQRLLTDSDLYSNTMVIHQQGVIYQRQMQNLIDGEWLLKFFHKPPATKFD